MSTTPDVKTFFLSFVRIRSSSVSVVFVVRVGSVIKQSRLKISSRSSRARPSLCCLSGARRSAFKSPARKTVFVSEETASKRTES